MKKILGIALLGVMLSLGASTGKAACFYPKSRHIEYWQHHSICYWDSTRHLWACSDWWSMDGTCDVDCDGNMTCDGDTTMRNDTMTDITLGPCAPVCE